MWNEETVVTDISSTYSEIIERAIYAALGAVEIINAHGVVRFDAASKEITAFVMTGLRDAGLVAEQPTFPMAQEIQRLRRQISASNAAPFDVTIGALKAERQRIEDAITAIENIKKWQPVFQAVEERGDGNV